jgi:hypothetical protein
MPLTFLALTPDAAQAQRRPPPHSEDVVQGAELAGLRSRSAPTGQPHLVDRAPPEQNTLMPCTGSHWPDATHGLPV